MAKGIDMKRALLVLTAALGAAAFSGCASTHGTGVTGMIRGSCARAPELCASCDQGSDCNACAQGAACGGGNADCGRACDGGIGHLLGQCSCYGQGCDPRSRGRDGLGQGCLGNGCLGHRRFGGVPEVTQPGPPVGQVAYPYYTTRGPRDFLMSHPRPLGP